MTAASSVSICSNALLMVGGQTINSLTGDLSDRERLCANLYPLMRDYMLAAHPWNCCRKRVLLNPDATGPSFGWQFAYTLPADFTRIHGLGQDDDAPIDYELEDGKLLCDLSPLYLRYLYLNTNEAKWSPLMVYAATMSMRALLAYPITQSTSLEQLLESVLEPILRRARAIDAQDRPPETFGDFPLLESRFSPVGRWGDA